MPRDAVPTPDGAARSHPAILPTSPLSRSKSRGGRPGAGREPLEQRRPARDVHIPAVENPRDPEVADEAHDVPRTETAVEHPGPQQPEQQLCFVK